MIAYLRIAVVVSLLAMLAFVLLPYDEPHVIVSSHAEPPPLSDFLLGLVLLAVVLLPISAYGLLRFRRWAPRLAATTVLLLVSVGVLVLLKHDPASMFYSVSKLARVMELLSAFSLAIAYALANTSRLKGRYRDAP